jgi:hypothetical protein
VPTVLNRASIAGCLFCAIGCCAIATHNAHFYMERPGDPCVYVAPCNPRQPLADLPEKPQPSPRPVDTRIWVTGTGTDTTFTVSATRLSSGRPWARGTIS